MCTTCFIIQKLCILPTQFVYVFHMILTANSDYFSNSIHQLVFCYRGAVCLLRGRDWNFKYYFCELKASKG
jgi:hypothetical protein